MVQKDRQHHHSKHTPRLVLFACLYVAKRRGSYLMSVCVCGSRTNSTEQNRLFFRILQKNPEAGMQTTIMHILKVLLRSVKIYVSLPCHVVTPHAVNTKSYLWQQVVTSSKKGAIQETHRKTSPYDTEKLLAFKETDFKAFCVLFHKVCTSV